MTIREARILTTAIDVRGKYVALATFRTIITPTPVKRTIIRHHKARLRSPLRTSRYSVLATRGIYKQNPLAQCSLRSFVVV